MVNHSGALLDQTYGALAHHTRREMLERLRDTPLRVTDLATPFDISLPAVSRHVRVLETAGLITRVVAGRDHVLSLQPEPLAAAGSWIETYREFWNARLAALDAHLRPR